MSKLKLAGLLLVVFGWLMLNLPHDSLWYDETVNAHLATSDWAAIWDWTTAVDNQLPLHFIVLKLWVEIAGTSEFSMRLFSLLSVWCAAAAMIALESRLFRTNAQFPWLAVSIFVLLGGTQYAAAEVRTYGLALGLAGWSLVCLLSILPYPLRKVRARVLVFMGLTALLMTTHYTAWLVLPVLALMLWLADLSRKQRVLTPSLLTLVPAALVIIGWLLMLGGRDINTGTAFAGSVGVRTAIETYTTFALFGQHLFTTSATDQAQFFFVLVLVMAVLWWQTQRTVPTMGVLVLGFLPLSAMVFAVNQIEGKLSGRHTWALWLVTPLVLRGGVFYALPILLQQVRRWAKVASLTAALLIVAGLFAVSQHTLAEEYRGDFRGAFAMINANAHPDDLLVLRDGTLFTAAEYYDVDIDYIGIPADKLTNVNHQVQFYEAMDNFQSADFLQRQRLWVLSWQAETMDPTALGWVIPEYYSQGQRRVWLEGGERGVSLYSYDVQPNLPPLQDHIVALEGVLQVPPDGLSLLGVDVYHNAIDAAQCVALVHAWWWRGETDYPTTVMSARLVAATTNRLVQQDMPPAGFFFPQAHWEPFVPTVGRFELRYPCEWRQLYPELALQVVVYDTQGERPSQPIDLGPVQPQAGTAN